MKTGAVFSYYKTDIVSSLKSLCDGPGLCVPASMGVCDLQAAHFGEGMDLSATEEASLGLAHALFTGRPVAGPVLGALKSVLQGVLAVR